MLRKKCRSPRFARDDEGFVTASPSSIEEANPQLWKGRGSLQFLFFITVVEIGGRGEAFFMDGWGIGLHFC